MMEFIDNKYKAYHYKKASCDSSTTSRNSVLLQNQTKSVIDGRGTCSTTILSPSFQLATVSHQLEEFPGVLLTRPPVHTESFLNVIKKSK